MFTMRLPAALPPTPTQHEFDVVISQMLGLPATGTTVREKPTGGSEWQTVILAEALAARGFRVGVIGPFFAYALDRGVHYLPAGEVIGRRDAEARNRPTAKIRTRVLVSERFGELPSGVEFERLVVDLHDLPDGRLSSVMNMLHEVADGRVVVHSNFTASLLDGWPSVNVIPCMLPDSFYETRTTIAGKAPTREKPRYVYGSAAMKGLEPTLALWKQIKSAKVPHFKRATLVVTSPGYDSIDPKWLEGAKDVEVVTGLSPAGMQSLLEDSSGIFMVSTYPETFGIVFHQCELAGKPAHVLQAHRQKDALGETLSRPDLMFTDPNAFVESFDTCIEPSQDWKPNDFSVSAVLPRWLDVLGLSTGAPVAEMVSTPVAGSSPAVPKQQENAA
jgi:hypothetical protein